MGRNQILEIRPGRLRQFKEGRYTDREMEKRLREKFGLILCRYANEQADPIWNVLIEHEVTRLFADEIRLIA